MYFSYSQLYSNHTLSTQADLAKKHLQFQPAQPAAERTLVTAFAASNGVSVDELDIPF